MGFKKVESTFAKPWKPAKKGEKIEGVFVGTDEIPSGRGDGKTFTSYRMRLKDGTIVGVAGAALASKMEQIPTGAILRLTLLEPLQTKNGIAHDYEVEVDDSVTLIDPYAVPRNTGDASPVGEIPVSANS